MNELLKMTNISKNFGTVEALSHVDLTLHEGEVLALMGENGAGKSTLMNILSGAIIHFEGDIFIQGKKQQVKSPVHARALGIAKIHQELQLVKELSVAENMFMGRVIRNKVGFVDKHAQEEESKKYLDLLEVDISPRRLIKSLRVGEQQMVEIAKALSLHTRILIMDEPTSAISKADSQKLFHVIRSLTATGVGIIYITHRMEEVFEIADRLTVLRDGLHIATLDAKKTTRNEIISLMVGREISNIYPKQVVPIGDEILRAEKLSYHSSKSSFKRALHDISFTLHAGEVLGIAGLLGSGRSELFEAIFGMYPEAVSGSVFIEGNKANIRNPGDAIKAGISFATEDRKGKGLVLLRSIGENMSLPMLKIFSRKLLFMNVNTERKQWQEQMENMRIKAESYKTLCQTLSGGNQQKVVLGRWLITKPKVLLLDEPTRGIDVGAKSEIYGLISTLAKAGIGIIMISSELSELIGIADRIITLCEGRLTGEFLREEATQEKLLYAATLRKDDDL